MTARYSRAGNQHLLFDGELLDTHAIEMFNAPASNPGFVPDRPPGGRGGAYFIGVGDRIGVMRHYRRGGLIGRVVRDEYLWLGLERSRPWREWNLLAELFDSGLPVPRPVAAHVSRHGCYYRGALLTLALPNTQSIAERARRTELPEEIWHRIGTVIHAFHEYGVRHPDLNAHNILADENGEIFLIDFDKGKACIGALSTRSAHGNLARLRRSLDKLVGNGLILPVNARSWGALLDGYRFRPTEVPKQSNRVEG
ncbi:MAG: 3-deoxy-D-manno-octulosonic acid kinase [Thiotrichales bacterium]